jgi:cell division initiation protein
MFESDDVHQPAESTRRPERRSVTVTPLDLRQCRFRGAFRGFDRDEVTSFLSEAAADYEQAVRDNERLREDMARLESSIAQFRNLESSLKTALISAQKVSDDMRATAEHEAARIVREAEARAELVQARAQARLEDVQREIEGVTLKRRHALTGIEATIGALRNTLDFIHEQDAREHGETPGTPAGAKADAPEAPRPDRVLPYQPRSEAASRHA